jgi:hypothetical protein
VLELLAPTVEIASSPKGANAGLPSWVLVLIVGVTFAVGVTLLVVALRSGRVAREVPCANCGRILMSHWTECLFCKMPRHFKLAALEFVSGPLAGRSVSLQTEVTTIGSAPGSTIVITDAGVSRKHAGIRKANGTYELADLGSTNGVYINGEKVARRQLQLGDVIRIGTSEMVFKT